MPVREVLDTRYFVWLGGIIMIEQGLPVTFLLLFAVLICVLHLMILLSSPGNKVNQWCCIAGLVLSLGV